MFAGVARFFAIAGRRRLFAFLFQSSTLLSERDYAAVGRPRFWEAVARCEAHIGRLMARQHLAKLLEPPTATTAAAAASVLATLKTSFASVSPVLSLAARLSATSESDSPDRA
jgi:hypothetical protein